MKTIRLLSLIAVALALIPSVAIGAAKQTGVVVDAANKTVGAYDPSSGLVLVDIKGLWFALPAGPAGFNDSASAEMTVFYPGPNCSGQAYVAPRSTTRFAIVVGGSNAGVFNHTLYYPGTNEQAQACQSFSVNPAEPLGANCANTSPQTLNLVPLESLPLSSVGFRPPFRLQ
jgi:hypothetical protein